MTARVALLLVLCSSCDKLRGQDLAPDAIDEPRAGTALCAGGGIATSGTYTAATCIAPAEVVFTLEASDGTYTLQAGPVTRLAP